MTDILRCVKHIPRFALLLCAALLLVQCSATESDEGEEDVIEYYGAIDAIDYMMIVLEEFTPLQNQRPSAQLGAFVAHYLVHQTRLQGALRAVGIQMELLSDEEYEDEESFALLEEMGAILQVDIPDMLNRSTRRGITFDEYMNDLLDVLSRGTEKHDELQQEYDTLNSERRDQRRTAGDIQRSLNSALREQDYGSASGLQQELIEAETDLAEMDVKLDQTRSVIRLYEKLIDVGEQRATAMRANREALLTGVMVTEIPGVDDLGLIRQATRSERQFDDSGSIFGPN